MESYEDMLIRHEGLRATPYIDSVGVQTIGSNVFPSFVMDNPINQHVAYSILSSETPLRFALSVAMPNVSGLIFCQFSHWSRRSLLAFLQTVLVGVELIISLRGILKILKSVIQLVSIAVIHRIKLVTRTYERLSDKSMNCCLSDLLLTVRHLGERYTQITSIADKRAFYPIRLAPMGRNVHHAPFCADRIQPFVSNNRFPYFHNRISHGIV